MRYEVEVIFKHNITIDDAKTDAEAIERACETAWQYDADETKATILHAYDPATTLSYHVGDHFQGQGGELIITAIYKKTISYEEVGNTSLEGTMMDRDKFDAAILDGALYGHRAETTLEKAMRLIDNYCTKEFKDRAEFNDMTWIPIGHTTVTDDELPIQNFADLKNYRIVRYILNVPVETRQYSSLEELIDNELVDLAFDEDLACFSDEQITYALENKDFFPSAFQMDMDVFGCTVGDLPGTWHVTDHVEIDGQIFWLMTSDSDSCALPIVVDSRCQLCLKEVRNGFDAQTLRLLKTVKN